MERSMPRTRIGLVGPGGSCKADLERALRVLVADPQMRQVVYLGADHAAEEVTAGWVDAVRAENERLLTRGAELAVNGSADDIERLLREPRSSHQLSLVHRLPDPPARAIELLDRWVLLAVHDKAVLDEEDIANAHVIAYGRADEASCKRFGPRCFFTPGPACGGKLGCVELLADGNLELRLLDLEGTVLSSQTVQAGGAKLVVAS
jgi:hypothetical protein